MASLAEMPAPWIDSEIVYVYFLVLPHLRLWVEVDYILVAVLVANDPIRVVSDEVVGKDPKNWKTLIVCPWVHPSH